MMRKLPATPFCILAFVAASFTDYVPCAPVKSADVYLDIDYNETLIRGKIYVTGVQYSRVAASTSTSGHIVRSPAHWGREPAQIWQTRSKFRSATGRFTVWLPQVVPSGAAVDVVYKTLSP